MRDSEKYQEAVYPGFRGQAKHNNSSRDASLIIHRRADRCILEKTLRVVVSCMDTACHNELVLAEKRKKKIFISLLVKLHSAYATNGRWLILL